MVCLRRDVRHDEKAQTECQQREPDQIVKGFSSVVGAEWLCCAAVEKYAQDNGDDCVTNTQTGISYDAVDLNLLASIPLSHLVLPRLAGGIIPHEEDIQGQ